MQGREDVLTVMTWWRGDPRPRLPGLAGFTLRRGNDDVEMALLQGSVEGAIAARRGAGNVPYVARVRGEPAGYAWVAGPAGHIGPLGLSFALDARDCYVWDLTVLEAGRPVAAGSHILRAIVMRRGAERVWLALPCERVHEAEAAGLQAVALVYREDGEARIEATGDSGRAAAAARVLGLEASVPALARQPSAA